MIEINNLKEIRRISITKFLQWDDRNGCYTDENRDIEKVERMSYEEAVKYFFGVINSDLYYSIADNIFELTYKEVIEYAKKFNVYKNTMHKLSLLSKQTKVTTEFYKSLLD